jgi:hypothetical protein
MNPVVSSSDRVVVSRPPGARPQILSRQTGALFGERVNDLQMPLVVFEERRVELIQLIFSGASRMPVSSKHSSSANTALMR